MQSAPLQKNISTATNNSTPSNSPKGGISLPAVPIFQQKPVQKKELEEEQPMQAKLATQLKADITAAPPPTENNENNNDGTAQLKELEEDMPLQGKFIIQRMVREEEQPVQAKFKPLFSAPTEPRTFQRFVLPKSTEPQVVQAPIQRFVLPTQPIQKKANNTGLPDNLKAGVENLSGFSMDDVKVHYNSAKPAQLQAHAYAQGTDIHIAPGQEKHLPHEAWHVVQQKQGRVQATLQMKGGIAVNDDKGLENEANVKGEKAASTDNIQMVGKIRPVGTNALVQLKKTTKPSSVEDRRKLIEDIGGKVKKDVLIDKVSDADKSDAIWEEALKVYKFNEAKGADYETLLSDAVKKYKNIVPDIEGVIPKQSLIDANKLTRTGYDSRFQKNYSNAPIEEMEPSTYRVNTEGYNPNQPNSEKPVVSSGEYKGHYSNEINLTDGSIKAAYNMAANVDENDWAVSYFDVALEQGIGLNNSEILWQQYKLAAEKKHKDAADKDEQVMNELKKISKIKRDSIINAESQVTVYMAYNDGEEWNSDKDLHPGTSEFQAVIATPNGKSSVFFLKDHMDQLEKTLDKITATSSGDSRGLDIIFKSI